jgi:hypothetical protein
MGQFGNNAIRTLLVEGKGERQFYRLLRESRTFLHSFDAESLERFYWFLICQVQIPFTSVSMAI